MQTYEEFRYKSISKMISELNEYQKSEFFGDVDDIESVMKNEPLDIIEWLSERISELEMEVKE